ASMPSSARRSARARSSESGKCSFSTARVPRNPGKSPGNRRPGGAGRRGTGPSAISRTGEGAGRTPRRRLEEADVQDPVLAHAARPLPFRDVAGVLADQGARDRRADRDLAFLDVGLVVADDLVGHLLPACEILQIDGRTEHAAAVAVEPPGIDNLGVAELRLQLGDAALDEAL